MGERRGTKKDCIVRELRCSLDWWRGQDSNLRPLGYEPNELPLLHPAVF